jgi:hypothetical protein
MRLEKQTPRNTAPLAKGAKAPPKDDGKDGKKATPTPPVPKAEAKAHPTPPAPEAPPPPQQPPATVTQHPSAAAVARKPSGVAQRAAGGLLRSKAFLERQASRFGRWSDTSHGVKAAESSKVAIDALKVAIDSLMKIPADYQPPSTPNALGVGAQVELKAKELERMADVFEGVEDKAMEVVQVYAGGRLRVRLANGDKMVVHRAQVNPIEGDDEEEDEGADE